MTASSHRRFVWPLLAIVAAGAIVAGTRVSLSEPTAGLFAVLMTTLGVAVLVALPGSAALAALSGRSLSPASRFGVLLAGSGVAAFADFWAWVATPTFGRVVAAVVLVASVCVIAIAQPTVLLDDRELRTPLGVMVVVALGYIGLAYAQGGLGGAHWTSGALAGDTTIAVTYRYWIAPDNEIPLLFAQLLAGHGSLTTRLPFNHLWHFSDRPPLQTGFLLMLYPLLGLKSFASQLLGSLLQALWIPALWILLRSRGVSSVRVTLVIVCTAATGTIFFNTIYVWPKMLAAALGLAAFAVVLEEGSLVLAAILAALALLAHGGVAFALLAMLPFIWRIRPSRLQAGLALAAGAAVYLPWMAYQHFLDPPGDTLLKWQLAAVLPPDRHSAFHDLVQAYTRPALHALVIDKLDNIEKLVYIPAIWTKTDPCCAGVWSGFVGTARFAEQETLLMAVGPLLLGFAALVSRAVRRSLRPVRPLFAFVLITLVVWVIVEYGRDPAGTVIHQGPYTLLVLCVGLAALATTYLPRIAAGLVIAASLAWFAIAWVPGLGFRPAQPGIAVVTDWPMVLLGVASLAIVGWLVLRSISCELRGPRRIDRALAEGAWVASPDGP